MKLKLNKLNKKNWIKVFKGLGIALAGTIVTFGINLLPQIDFGENSIWIAPIIMAILNAIRKMIEVNK